MSAPTREEAGRSADLFYAFIRDLVDNKLLTYSRLADPLGVHKSTVKRRFDNRSLSTDQRILVLDYIDEKNIMSGGFRARTREIPHALYFAMLEFLAIRETAQDDARAYALGTYEFWRHSLDHPGKYVHGKLVLSLDESTGAIEATLVQPRRKQDGVRAGKAIFKGYFFRTANQHAMLLRDMANRDVRMALLQYAPVEYVGRDVDPKSCYEPGTRRIIEMEGLGFGLNASQLFVSSILLILVDNADELKSLDSRLDIKNEEDVPPAVINRLRGVRMIRF